MNVAKCPIVVALDFKIANNARRIRPVISARHVRLNVRVQQSDRWDSVVEDWKGGSQIRDDARRIVASTHDPKLAAPACNALTSRRELTEQNYVVGPVKLGY
jgi:hypothetical protein